MQLKRDSRVATVSKTYILDYLFDLYIKLCRRFNMNDFIICPLCGKELDYFKENIKEGEN